MESRRPLDDLSDATEMGDSRAPSEHPPPAEADAKRGTEGPASTPEASATLATRVRRRSEARERRPARELARGETVGRYVILEKLGAGAMGIVHAAWDPDLDRKVALKLLHGERHGQRLLREAQAMARLSHPNVITVHDVGEVEARVFMAMEFVEGTTLAGWASERPHEVREILEVFVAAGRGLAAAHQGGLIHRDFKPDNVMIGRDGRVRVMDFGLVRAAGEPDATRSQDGESALESWSGDSLSSSSRTDALSSNSVLESRLTQEGSLLGTPAYMAPEQLRGESADARSDQFAFCVALWECLYGMRPFAGDNPLSVLFAITHAELREPTPTRAVPSWVRRVIARGLAADPSARWPDMNRLIAALADDPRVRTRRWVLGIGSLVVAAAAAIGVGVLWPEPPTIQPPCQDVDAPILAVWTPERASALQTTFAASELVYAEDSATRVIASLDRWAEQWSTSRRDACEASEVRREQSTDMLDRRMACLDQRLHGFTALVELFGEADAAVIEKAVEAAESLPRLAPCSDRAWLSATQRPPEDPASAESVEAIERDAARVHAWVEGGKASDARGLAEDIDARARALAWPAAEAEAALALGRVHQELGEFGEARDALERAFFAARRASHDEVAIDAAALLVYVYAVGLGDYVVGGQWLHHGEAEADRLGRAELRAKLESSAGIYWYMQDDMAAAARSFAAELELLQRNGAGPVERGAAHVNYGSVLIRVDARGYADEAIAQSETGLGLLEQAFGPGHPQLGLALGNVAIVYGYLEQHEQAIARLERALAILERAYGPDHPLTALTELNLAINLIAAQGDLTRALALAEAALRVHEATLGSEHSMTAESLRTIAQAQHAAGRPGEAIVALDRAIAIWELPGATKESVISARYLRATCLLELGRTSEAGVELDAIAERYADSPARAEVPKTILRIAERLVGQPGQRERVRELLGLARRGIDRTGDTQLLGILAQLEHAARSGS
ncbi:protein kinase domain-containing protein [Nannocystaceae bacterium ST9]